MPSSRVGYFCAQGKSERFRRLPSTSVTKTCGKDATVSLEPFCSFVSELEASVVCCWIVLSASEPPTACDALSEEVWHPVSSADIDSETRITAKGRSAFFETLILVPPFWCELSQGSATFI